VGALIGALLAGGSAAGTALRKGDLTPLAERAPRERVRRELASLANPVRLLVFTQQGEKADLSGYAAGLANSLAELSPKVSAEVFDIGAQAEKAKTHGVDKAPAVVVLGEKDHGIRFFGVPGGLELDSLVSAIKRVSARDPGLSDATRKALAGLQKPVHLEVFVTLNCAYCPEIVELAHRLALASDLVTADMVELSAFRARADALGVRAVPAVVVNGTLCFLGAKREEQFVEAVLAAVPND